MRPEGASILSARCEIREIPLTVTSKTDSTLYSTSKTRRAGPSAHCGTRLHERTIAHSSLVDRRSRLSAYRALHVRSCRAGGGAAAARRRGIGSHRRRRRGG